MGRPKSGVSAPKGGMSILDRFGGQSTTGETVSTSQQMKPVAAPVKATPVKSAPAKDKPQVKPKAQKPAPRPVAKPKTGGVWSDLEAKIKKAAIETESAKKKK